MNWVFKGLVTLETRDAVLRGTLLHMEKIPSITLKTDKKLSFACLACQTKMQNGFYPVVFLHFSY